MPERHKVKDRKIKRRKENDKMIFFFVIYFIVVSYALIALKR